MGLFFACVYRTADIPSIALVFSLILFEGLIGGAAYVNTFYRILTEVRFKTKTKRSGYFGCLLIRFPNLIVNFQWVLRLLVIPLELQLQVF